MYVCMGVGHIYIYIYPMIRVQKPKDNFVPHFFSPTFTKILGIDVITALWREMHALVR